MVYDEGYVTNDEIVNVKFIETVNSMDWGLNKYKLRCGNINESVEITQSK